MSSIYWWSALLVFNSKKEIDMPLNTYQLTCEILNRSPNCPKDALAKSLSCSEGRAETLRSLYGTCKGNAETMRQKHNEASRRCRAKSSASEKLNASMRNSQTNPCAISNASATRSDGASVKMAGVFSGPNPGSAPDSTNQFRSFSQRAAKSIWSISVE